jgi:hypothetical protein
MLVGSRGSGGTKKGGPKLLVTNQSMSGVYLVSLMGCKIVKKRREDEKKKKKYRQALNAES